MIKSLLTMYYLPRYASVLVYMLQNTEYRAGPYLAWYWRTQDFSRVMHRRSLDYTRSARLLRLALVFGMAIQIVIGLRLILLWSQHDLIAGNLFGLALLLSYPIVWAHLVVVPLVLGRIFIVEPRERELIKESDAIFAHHPGIKIAVAGSYGKTSMKELLLTVLSEGKNVAATPANKNVAISHARFAKTLTGKEDILIIEYGEGKPGDVKRFAKTTHPTHGIITGLAPAHLDRYKTLQAAGVDIFSLADYLQDKNVYVNGDSEAALPFIKGTSGIEIYDANSCLGWKVKDIALTTESTKFKLVKGRKTLSVTSGLLGKHQVGPLSLAVALGLEFGLSEKQVLAGVAKTAPFEHRMQTYKLSGAWVIDDTYNGNIDGIKAGTELLASLDAKRKLYVSPGLVDQGRETKPVHIEMGKLIAKANPDVVVLMQNSVTKYIQQGLDDAEFKGEVRIEDDPLTFYTNLDQFVSAGDLVLMQNDWTDNYA